MRRLLIAALLLSSMAGAQTDWLSTVHFGGVKSTATTGYANGNTSIDPTNGICSADTIKTTGVFIAGSGPTTLTDSAGKILSAALNTVAVGQGGTGAATLTSNGVVIGNGTSAVTVTAEGATGTVFAGVTGGDPVWSASPTLAGDIAVNGGDVTSTAATFNVTGTGATSVTMKHSYAGNCTFDFDAAPTDGSSAALMRVFRNVTTSGARQSIFYKGDGSNTQVLNLNHGTGALTLTGSATISSTLGVTGATTLTDDLAVNGGDITSTASTMNVFNGTSTTVNAFGAATTIAMGAATGTMTVKNATLDVDGGLSVQGATNTMGDASTDTFTFTGRVVHRQANDAGPMTATGGTLGEILFNASDSKFYGCTVTHASAATWVALN